MIQSFNRKIPFSAEVELFWRSEHSTIKSSYWITIEIEILQTLSNDRKD